MRFAQRFLKIVGESAPMATSKPTDCGAL